MTEITYHPPKKRREVLNLPPPEKMTGNDRNRIPAVIEGVRAIDPKRETFEERSARYKDKRIKYAAMQAHMERAAIALAAGATFRMAAADAGISVRQVKKYYTEADFRSRIEELRQTMFSRIRGRVIKEMAKRTAKGKISKIELLDLLRMFDRVAGPIGGKAGVAIAGDVNVTTNYDAVLAALIAPQRSGESKDFPIYRPEDLLAPGSNPPE